MECSAWWSELPKDLQEKALAWLPVERLGRYRHVCKEWNALFSSTKFITNDWGVAPPNRKPWLVLCHNMKSLDCMAYCFYTNTWKRFSIAFINMKYLPTYQRNNAGPFLFSWISVSAAGLILASLELSSNVISMTHSNSDPRTHIVSNPLTGTWLELPRINDDTIEVMTLVPGDGNNGDTYKVIAVTLSGIGQRVEIYDSCLKSWSTAGHLPQNLKVIVPFTSGLSRRIVISEDLLYCKGFDVNSRREGIITFHIRNGTSIFMSLPLENVPWTKRSDSLFSCGSRVLLGTGIFDRYRHNYNIFISEFEKPTLGSNYSEVREIARIPPSVLEDFKRKEDFILERLSFNFEGMQDLVCITHVWANEVLVYNLSENIRRWLPKWLPRGSNRDFTSIFAFQPKPNMKV